MAETWQQFCEHYLQWCFHNVLYYVVEHYQNICPPGHAPKDHAASPQGPDGEGGSKL
jgi:hypothetical protein